MANGVPVVATKVSGIPEVIKNGVTGLLVSPGDERMLAQAIGKLMDDPRLRTELARSARRLIDESFNIRTNANRLVELFET
jgi:glycosyltransferase involved in cell wall biosynthesis